MEALLRDGLSQLGLPLDAIPAFLKYGELLLETNRVLNLTAITEPDEVARLHFLDCAALLTLERFQGRDPVSTPRCSFSARCVRISLCQFRSSTSVGQAEANTSPLPGAPGSSSRWTSA